MRTPVRIWSAPEIQARTATRVTPPGRGPATMAPLLTVRCLASTYCEDASGRANRAPRRVTDAAAAPRGIRSDHPAALREHGVDEARPVVELVVEVHGGVDEREVAERLREVAELLPREPDLLGVEAEVVRVGEHLLEHELRLVEEPRPRERVDVPERAQRERALGPAQAVR